MLSMTVKSDTVFDPEIRERVLYFNLEKPEVVKLLSDYPKLLATAEAMRNQAAAPLEVWEFLTLLVQYSYGKRINGDEFLKSDEVRLAFIADKPYSALLDQLMGDGDASKAIDFMTNVMPAGAIDAARAKLDEEEKAARPVAPQDHLPAAGSRREARAIRESEPPTGFPIGG